MLGQDFTRPVLRTTLQPSAHDRPCDNDDSLTSRTHIRKTTLLGVAIALAYAGLLSIPADSASPPYGIEKRVPWTTSRVIGSPEPPSPYMPALAFPHLEFDHGSF